MNFQQEVILTPKSSGYQYWIAQNLLQDRLGLSDNYLRFVRNTYKNSVPPALRSRSILPATGKSWRWTRINGQFYYDYDYIPNRAPKYYKASINIDQLTRQCQYQPVRNQIIHYINEYYTETARQYPPRNALARQAVQNHIGTPNCQPV